jgi:hypothetical protein
MLNEYPPSSAISVAAVHLLALCAGRRNPLSSVNYCKLIELSQRKATPRDKHVVRVLVQFMMVAHASDVENFPNELLLRFPDAPLFVRSFFSQGAMHSEQFLNAWVKAHSELHEASMNYMRVLAKSLPITILAHFPVDDWRGEFRATLYEKVEEKAKRRKKWITFGLCALVGVLVVGVLIVSKL